MNEFEEAVQKMSEETKTLETMQSFLKAQFEKAMAYETAQRKTHEEILGAKYPGGYIERGAQLATIAGAYAQVTMALNFTKG